MGFGKVCKIFLESRILLFRDFANLENVLELEEDAVSLCCVSNSVNVALSQVQLS